MESQPACDWPKANRNPAVIQRRATWVDSSPRKRCPEATGTIIRGQNRARSVAAVAGRRPACSTGVGGARHESTEFQRGSDVGGLRRGVARCCAVWRSDGPAADLPITKAPPKVSDSGSPFWAEIDYLAWTVKGDRPPPLVTTSPAGT